MDNILGDILIGVPEEIANMQLPSPELRNIYRDEANRIFYIDDQINETTLDLIKFIMQCNREDSGKPVEDRKRILVMIDSPGGSVEVEQSIIGAMKMSTTPVWTCVYCTAYSASADLLACGQKRFAMPFTSIMFHAGSAVYQGSQSQVDSAKTFMDKMSKRVNEEVFSRVNFDKKTIKRLKTDDIYFNEVEALESGVIDKIVKSFDELM